MKDHMLNRPCVSPRGVLSWTFLALMAYQGWIHYFARSENSWTQSVVWQLGAPLAFAALAALLAAVEARFFKPAEPKQAA